MFFILMILIVGIFLFFATRDKQPIGNVSDIVLYNNWKNPTFLSVNSDKWEDGAYITGDGSILYFVIYHGDLLRDILAGSLKGEIDVYQSRKPFTSKSKVPISEKTWAEGGVMISGNDMYYMSNKYAQDGKYDTDIYKNGVRMSFSTSEDEDDPHYCAARDELYFWKKDNGDSNIYVYSNNEIKKLPNPINTASNDIQPFLTTNCQEMWFTSDREGNSRIYHSFRNGDTWGEVHLRASSTYGVGEPTLTDDEKYLFFVKIDFKDGKHDSNIIRAER